MGGSKKGGHDFWLKFSVGELGGNYETINYFENFIKTLIKSFSAKSAAWLTFSMLTKWGCTNL